jgi:chromosomal replication initiator protein
LHQAGKQLILTSDKPPRDLDNVDDRLISRFHWGLIVDIQPPDFETRMAILQKKSIDEGIELQNDVLEYLAKNIKSSVRELEGCLISILAKVTLDRRELTLDLAKEVVYGIGGAEPKPITIDEIKQTVADYYKFSVDLIESKSRKHEITLARQMSMFLAKQLTQLSLKSIGASFGNRDHSTVLHSCQTIENYFATDSTIRLTFETLKRKLNRS